MGEEEEEEEEEKKKRRERERKSKKVWIHDFCMDCSKIWYGTLYRFAWIHACGLWVVRNLTLEQILVWKSSQIPLFF